MCLYRAREHRLLMLMRHLALERLVPDCQRVVRGFFAREMKRRLLKANAALKDVRNRECSWHTHTVCVCICVCVLCVCFVRRPHHTVFVEGGR